jgi:ribosomal protein L29
MTQINKEEIRKMSIAELQKALQEAKKQKSVIGLKLRAKQSHDQKEYKYNKLLIAQVSTELRAKELTNESN